MAKNIYKKNITVKIMHPECRTPSLLDCYAEMHLILCKD